MLCNVSFMQQTTASLDPIMTTKTTNHASDSKGFEHGQVSPAGRSGDCRPGTTDPHAAITLPIIDFVAYVGPDSYSPMLRLTYAQADARAHMWGDFGAGPRRAGDQQTDLATRELSSSLTGATDKWLLEREESVRRERFPESL